MPRGQVTPDETKVEALAMLEGGATYESVAGKYGVSVDTIKNWRRRFEEDGTLEDDPEASESESEQDTEYAEVLAQLPAPPPDSPTGRRQFTDDYKYTVSRAVLARQISLSAMVRAHRLTESALRGWMKAVEKGELRGRRIKRTPANGHSRQVHVVSKVAPAPAPAAPPSRQTDLALYTPPAPKQAAQPIALTPHGALEELERLRQENIRLKVKLRQALSMVIDDHD